MSVQEFVLRVLLAVQPIIPYMLITTAVTAVVLAVLLVISRGLWFDKKGFRWLGIFYEMQGFQSVRFACAWVKLNLIVLYLVSFQKLEVAHYILLLVPCVLYAVEPGAWLRMLSSLFGAVMQLAGLLAANIICGYIRDLDPGMSFILIYALVSIFLILYEVYLFLNELNNLSQGRRARLGS